MNKKKTKINTILAIVITIGVLISVILLGIWGVLRNKNTNLLPLKILIAFFLIGTALIGAAGGVYNQISNLSKSDNGGINEKNQ